jgi:serine/threonine protein kinase
MSLTSGTRLGPYEIVSPIGAGGMGEVYRAKDTKLNREVAIKVLPESFALDADRVARFTREAQVLASLNHPNIAAIYGIEESRVQGPGASVRALVKELVEGDDLSALIAGGTPADLKVRRYGLDNRSRVNQWRQCDAISNSNRCGGGGECRRGVVGCAG